MRPFACIASLAAVFVVPANATATEPQPTPSNTVFSCQHFGNAGAMRSNKPKKEDMRIEVVGDTSKMGAQWIITRPDKPVIFARSFEAAFGMHGSVGLVWKDENGKVKQAFVAFAETHDENGLVVFWFNFNRPGLFMPPGYGCDNEAMGGKDAAA